MLRNILAAIVGYVAMAAVQFALFSLLWLTVGPSRAWLPVQAATPPTRPRCGALARVAPGSAGRRAASQPSATSNAVTFRSSRLNSTPIR